MIEALLHRFDIESYHNLISAGILREDDRVELIEGRIVDMTPMGSRHVACVNRFNTLLSRQLQGKAIVSVQSPIRLSKEQSEPEPDIALLKFREDFYSEALPESQDVLWLIEVADTSMEYDREVKIPLYARANIREAWLVNLLENSVEIFASPSGGRYEFHEVIDSDRMISPMVFPEISIAVSRIL